MVNSPWDTQVAGHLYDAQPPRKIPAELDKNIASRLASLAPMCVNITVPIGDADAQALGQEIKRLLVEAGWPFPQGLVAVEWETPIYGFQFIFQSTPEKDLTSVFSEFLAAVNETKKMWINPKQAEDSVQINFGAQRPASNKKLHGISAGNP